MPTTKHWWKTTEFEIVTGDEPEVVASFPYSAGKQAIGICTMFAEGYGVLNAEGKTLKGSCNRQPIACWLGTRTMQYNTAPMSTE